MDHAVHQETSGRDLVIVRDLNKSFGSGNSRVDAVRNVSLSIAKGEILLIMGPSGSGKTTLLTMLGALLTPDSGTIIIDGEDITLRQVPDLASYRATNIGFVFQSFALLTALTALENVLIALELTRSSTSTNKLKAVDMLSELGMSERLHFLPKELSGGEKQRVSFVRALINDPMLILADEPTANLDSRSGHQVMELIRKITKERGKTVVIVSHDMRIADIADRVLWLEDGTIKEGRFQLVMCPVCGMKIDRSQAMFSSNYNGKELYFCSARDKETFDIDPRQYANKEYV